MPLRWHLIFFCANANGLLLLETRGASLCAAFLFIILSTNGDWRYAPLKSDAHISCKINRKSLGT